MEKTKVEQKILKQESTNETIGECEKMIVAIRSEQNKCKKMIDELEEKIKIVKNNI